MKIIFVFEKKQQNHYKRSVLCLNCWKEVSLKIKNGIRVEDYTLKTPCPNCGCVRLRSY